MSVAKDIIWPNDPDILVRVVFLHVGQGSSSIVLVADNGTYKSVLVDINSDSENGGIDVPGLMKDLVGDTGLDVFANTHPHDDHLRGISDLSDSVSIGEVWHSGHVPGKDHRDAYDEMKKVIEKVKQSGGKEVELLGSRDGEDFGEARYHILAPAEHVVDEISGESGETRYCRIHEHCAVLKFGVADAWVIIPGDADRKAFETHIAEYHKDRLGSLVLAAAHHGSRTFFKNNEEDNPYTDGLDYIDPEYVVISAPTTDESPHDHPHEDAVEIYEERVGKDNVLHTGEKRYSFICDIYRDGTYSGVADDQGKLAEAYPVAADDPGENSGNAGNAVAVGSAYRPRTTVDDRPMGAR